MTGRGTRPFRMSPLGGPKGQPPPDLPPTMLVIFHLRKQPPGGNAPDVTISETRAALIDLA